MFAEVAIKVPLFRAFDYAIPKHSTVTVGCRVKVPFGNRKLVAVVLAIKSHTDVPEAKLKTIAEVLDSSPILSTDHIKFLRFTAQYYAHPLGETLFTALPAALREGEHPDKTTVATFSLTAKGKQLPTLRAKKQQALLKQLNESGESSLTELKALGFSKQQINGLLDKQLIAEQVKHDVQWQSQTLNIAAKPRLNEEQATACSAINQQADFRCFLLEGVTGSGKTEVYLQSLERVLQSGMQALILVPEIGLTPQTVNRFRRRFPDTPIDLWHSNLTDNERLHTWRRAEKVAVRW